MTESTSTHRGGLDNARAAGQRAQFRYPRLRLKAGDRARFHFLSDGNDEFLAGSRFHLFKQQTRTGKTYNKEVLCLRVATDGDEACPSCEEGQDETGMRMSVWIWLHFILHLGDNPDAEGVPWEQVQMKGRDKQPGRVMFKEDVDEPILIWMGYGKEWAWFEQYTAASNQYGTLEAHMYELKRVGSGMADTDYTLAAVKKGKLPKVQRDKGVEARVPIFDVFQETTSDGPAAPRPSRLSEEMEEGADDGPPAGTGPLPDDEMATAEEGEQQALPEMEEPEGSLI